MRLSRRTFVFLYRLTCGQLKGFTLYATRTILSGGGTELVELTRTNLRELEAG
jgi:pyruvate dehydrogenase (quinone)